MTMKALEEGGNHRDRSTAEEKKIGKWKGEGVEESSSLEFTHPFLEPVPCLRRKVTKGEPRAVFRSQYTNGIFARNSRSFLRACKPLEAFYLLISLITIK